MTFKPTICLAISAENIDRYIDIAMKTTLNTQQAKDVMIALRKSPKVKASKIFTDEEQELSLGVAIVAACIANEGLLVLNQEGDDATHFQIDFDQFKQVHTNSENICDFELELEALH